VSNELYDVAIIGGGPAGSSSAYYCAKMGLKTILFEKKAYPRDKPCGGALSYRTLSLLGEKAKQSINCSIDNITIYSPSLKHFINRGNKGYFVIREQFDEAMARDAQEQGVSIFDGEAVLEIKHDSNNDTYIIVTAKRIITANYVILATGVQNNKLIRSLGIRSRWPEGYLAICVNSETEIEQELLTDLGIEETSLQIFFGVVPRGYGWYFIKKGYINIGIGATWVDIKEAGPKNVYERFVEQLKGMNLIPSDIKLAKAKSYTLVFKKPVKRSVFHNLLLVGDAAGFVSPVTGEGLYYCVSGGKFAAEAIYNNKKYGKPLKAYQKKWMKDFGKDLSQTGLFLQNFLYKTLRRMELIVNLAIKDDKLADLVGKMIMGILDYGKFLRKVIFHLPVTIIKTVKK